jgi:alkylated DNA repair dioxygenase AlkB
MPTMILPFERALPDGFAYRPQFVSEAEEAALLDEIARITFDTFEMRGVAARRRVAFYGESYGRASAAELPSFLLPLRSAAASWVGVAAESFRMALVNEYRAGSPIGWHRDAPQYDIVVGVSLLSPCVMRFRPYRAPSAESRGTRRATHELTLERRSAYLIAAASRSEYEHHIPPVSALRYSITFRTLRPSRERSPDA